MTKPICSNKVLKKILTQEAHLLARHEKLFRRKWGAPKKSFIPNKEYRSRDYDRGLSDGLIFAIQILRNKAGLKGGTKK